MLDELGDVLFQVHFLALLLEERGEGDLAAVAELCREKLIRRHPHVFGEVEAETAGEVLKNWDRIKVEVEGGGERPLFADVPENLPALLYARKIQRRAATRADGEGLAADPVEAADRRGNTPRNWVPWRRRAPTVAPPRSGATTSRRRSATRSLRSSTPRAASAATRSWRCGPRRSASRRARSRYSRATSLVR